MYQALFSTSETIRRYIEDRIGGIATSGVMPVLLNTPQEIRASNREGVSVWLYRVVRDPERLNDPPERLGWAQVRTPPLPLRLHYLITPVTDNANPPLGSPIDEQMLLGRILQMFHSHPVLRGADLQGQFIGTATELYMRFEPMSLEEITRVWEALEGSYQLSVCYEVSVVNIEAETEPESMTLVEVALPEYGVIVS
jgi:Pvc16 N-terminal domain